MKPDDLLVLLKLVASGDANASVRKLGADLALSKTAVADSLERLSDVGLLKGPARARRVNRLAARDLFVHGMRWVAPAKIGDFELGIATAHAAPPLADKFRGDSDPLVLALAQGPMRGRALSPVHLNAAAAANRDEKLHRLLALVDALRVGRSRDRAVAEAELDACM